jgi:Protein of unknown function (DUF2690)
MDLVPFLKAITSVTNPITLITFIVVALLAALLLVLKFTNGLEKTQEQFFKYLPPHLFVQIINRVLWILLAIAAMLFVLLGYDYNTNLQKSQTQTGLACYADTCTGRAPKVDNDCDKGMVTSTSETVSFPELGEKFKLLNLEIKYSARCNARWVKLPKVPGATIYFEGQDKKTHQPLIIKKEDTEEPQVTPMLSGNIENIRACVSHPTRKEPQCTGLIK